MSDPRQALERLRSMAGTGQLEAFCEGHGIELLVAFGSAVQDDDAPARDLDLAVLAGRGQEDWAWLEVVTEIIALVGGDDVDVMDLGRAGVLARSNALGWGIPLYERDAGLFAREQMAAMGQRMELGWLADLDLDLLAGR